MHRLRDHLAQPDTQSSDTHNVRRCIHRYGPSLTIFFFVQVQKQMTSANRIYGSISASLDVYAKHPLTKT
jgi:hypothetical protein